MPNIWTHILFCEEVVDSISKTHTPFFLNERFMKLGAQGPDLFFYYQFWPWIKHNPDEQIGTVLHTKHCGPFIMDLIDKAKTMDEQIQAYVFGFITHHILDRNTHPYIHYRAGYKGNNHQRLEVIIDTLIMEKYHHLKTWKLPVYKEIDVGFFLPKDIGTLLEKNIQKHYPDLTFNLVKYIQKSYRDMKFAQRLLYDPYGWKNTVFKSIISAYSHRPVTDDKDYLNLNHHTWYHPATKEPSTKSFIDLYNKSKVEACDIMANVIKYWVEPNESLKTQLTLMIGNISYDTGKDLALNVVNQYSDSLIE
ncbi:zinc dependent phospholipase C family protein [Cerasibacillus terrae]|uniref:Zinc dependent phospholipase C family protein n=1 Tax=Cerasibacillus terrae TaxID=2498845 RepID=A0A5C8NT23_9BACI|nr:zinc dependent phospholipase C family protein [Cerasibacillus terrae]TXL63975.1 zinc dependent phospholipase C family protein [Cerasibacillus terrae]